jgi:hypothetical protein
MKTTNSIIAAILVMASWTQTAWAATGNAYADAVISDNPLVYYRLDETSGATATDTSPNARHGTYVNTSLANPSYNSVLGTAAGFNNNNSSVAVPALGTYNQITIETWVKPSSFATFDALYTYDGWTGGCIHQHFKDGGVLGFSVNGNDPTDIDVGGFVAGQWRHVVVTYDSTAKVMSLYTNGVLLATHTYTTAVAANLGAAHIGNWSGGSRAYDGLIDEVVIYGNVLSASQVLAHYTNGASAPIVIIDQPASVAALAGEEATFTVGAVSYVGAMSYQWQTNGVDLTGATSASVTTPAISLSDSGMLFRCLVSAGGISVTSQVATLTVLAPKTVPGPLAWLNFETTLADQTYGGNRHDGTVVGGANYSADTANATAGANSFNFPGSSRVELANSGDLNMNTGAPFTISVWIKTAFNDAANHVIFGKAPTGFSSTTHTPSLFVNGNGNLVYDVFFVGAATSTANVRNGEWTHVALSCDGTTCRFYVNGVADITTGIAANEPTASDWVFSIGQSLNTAYPTGDWVGNLDEFAFWNVSLDMAQVLGVYEHGVPRVPAVITQQPAAAAAYTNQTATFLVTAVSYAGALSYQWQSNGVDVVEATSASYTTSPLSLANNGDHYKCVVTASGYPVTSRDAVVYVVEYAAVTGPLMWLSFEDTLLDQGGSTNRHDGTLVGNAALDPNTANATAGNFSANLLAPGRVDVAHPTDLNVSFNTPFSIAAWILADPSDVNSVIVAKSPPAENILSSSGGTHTMLLYITSDGRLAYDIWNVGEVRSSAIVRNGNWMHVAVTFDGSACRLFVNGQPDATSALSSANEGANGEPAWQFTIGQTLNTNFPGGDFTGNIDEVAFWSTALSQAQILGVFNDGMPQVAITITQEPVDAVTSVGGVAQFTVAANAIGTTLPLQYQWQNGTNNIPDATNAIFTTSALVGADNGNHYRCVVTAGPATANSREAVVTVLDVTGNYASAVLADTPLVYYRFEEPAGVTTAYDVSGHGKHGAYANVTLNSATFTDVLGAAVAFNGSSSSVAVPAVTGGPFSKVSLEVWVKPNSFNGGLPAIYDTDTWAAGATHLAFQNSGTVNFSLDGGGDIAGPSLALDQWAHLVITYDSTLTSGHLKYYVNGLLVQTSSVTANNVTATMAAAHLGAFVSSRWYNGSMDEFAIYGSVLSADRVAAHYASGTEKPVVITQQPENAKVLAGTTATFAVGAVSFAGVLSYQWQTNGVDILDATNTSYVTPPVTLLDNSAKFRCVVSVGATSLTSGDAVLSVVAVQNVPVPSAWLPFENSLADQSGQRRHDGALVGGATYSADVANASAGKNSMSFPGSSRVELANSADLNMNTGAPFTISVWIKTAFNDAANHVIFGKAPTGFSSATHTPSLFVNGNGNLVYDVFFVGAATSTANVRNGQWTHVAMSCDGTTCRFYVNGVADMTTGIAANEPTASDWVFSIGQSLNTAYPTGDWVGGIDEVAFWQSTLSPDQVFTLFARGSEVLAPAKLNCSQAGNLLTFSWEAAGYKLQENSEVSNPVGWSDLPNGGSSPVNATIGSENRFFRLIKP